MKQRSEPRTVINADGELKAYGFEQHSSQALLVSIRHVSRVECTVRTWSAVVLARNVIEDFGKLHQQRAMMRPVGTQANILAHLLHANHGRTVLISLLQRDGWFVRVWL